MSDTEAVAQLGQIRDRIYGEIGQVVIGQKQIVAELLIALLAGGHCLLVGVPGLAKTTLIQTLARTLDLSFGRIQFTPDLMPSDITGTEVLEEDIDTGRKAFRFIRGPLFANVILADEINRTPPKTQAALLQAMQEHAVTAAGETMQLSEPFFVLATQNPIEQEGTYPLPEAQVDRFMLKLRVTYPSRDEELRILRQMARTATRAQVEAVLQPADFERLRDLVERIYMDEKVEEYVVDVVYATREPARFGLELDGLIEYGASPRATIYLTLAAKAYAVLHGRGYVTPQDVKTMAPDVLRHRVIVSYEAEAEERTADDLVGVILDAVPVP